MIKMQMDISDAGLRLHFQPVGLTGRRVDPTVRRDAGHLMLVKGIA